MRIILFVLLFCHSLHAKELSKFKARIYSADKESGLVKFRTEFSNSRFIVRGTRLKFTSSPGAPYQCEGIVIGRSRHHFLMKVYEIGRCSISQSLTPGISASFTCLDLERNIEATKELVVILNKKKVALRGQMESTKRKLDSFVERNNAVNARYSALRAKLEGEQSRALAALENERLMELQKYKNFASRLDEIDFKLEKYRIEDTNKPVERWSLDPNFKY